MSGMFVNKLAGALLASGLGIILINKFSGLVMHADVPKPENFAYSLATEASTETVEVAEIVFPSPAWLDARDAEKGAKVFKKCTSCHTAEAGGKDGTGPALWNIVGKPMGNTDGFSYSSSLTAMGAEGGVWGYEELDAFLTKPKDYVAKTKMAFVGLKKEKDRAAVIEYLRLAADAPMEQLTVTADVPDAAEELVGEVVEIVEETPVDDGH